MPAAPGAAQILLIVAHRHQPPEFTLIMNCRPGCGACCIAPSISSPIPGMPLGKPAGEKCVQLDDDMRCKIFGRADRPQVCGSLEPETAMCGNDREHAIAWIRTLEDATTPNASRSLPAVSF